MQNIFDQWSVEWFSYRNTETDSMALRLIFVIEDPCQIISSPIKTKYKNIVSLNVADILSLYSGSYTHRILYHLPPPLFPVKWSSIWQPGGWGEVWDELPLISLGDTFPPTQDESIFKMFPAITAKNNFQKLDKD